MLASYCIAKYDLLMTKKQITQKRLRQLKKNWKEIQSNILLSALRIIYTVSYAKLERYVKYID